MTEQHDAVIETNENEECNMKYYNSWRTPPKEVTKQFNTGTFKGTDIKPQWRYESLTKAFGLFGWRVEITKQWTESYGTDPIEVKSYCNVNLYVKDPETGEWCEPMAGTGGNTVVFKNGRVSDEGHKMALTDAISNACQRYGIGADIYMGLDESKYLSNQPNNKQQPKKSTPKPTIQNTGDITDTIYNNDRSGNIMLIQENLKNSNPESSKFRKAMVNFVKGKGKQTYQGLDDKELVEFLLNELGK